MPSNETITGTGSDTIVLKSLPIIEIYASVQVSSMGISLDGGDNFLTLPIGWHRLPIGQVKRIMMQGSGSWQLLVYYN